MAKPKKPVRTKAQLIADMQKSAEWKKRMDFARNKFYPALIEASTSIDDAKMLLSSINNVLMEKFLAKMKEQTVKDIKLTEALDPKDEKYGDYLQLISLFNDMSLFEAKTNIEGMKGEIETWLTDEMRERSLESLRTKWIDQL